jgi:DNA-binding LytR/AlgR family response regulator
VTARVPTALIAEDEPLLRDALQRMLAQAWPGLDVVAQARNGREAIESFDTLRPDVCFLDVHMPGMTGIDVARHIGHRAHIVFVTAYDQYAVQAFSQGVLDYLVKPVETARLAETVTRLQERLRAAQPALNTAALLQLLASSLEQKPAPEKLPQEKSGPEKLRWVRASVGHTVRLISTSAIDFLRSESSPGETMQDEHRKRSFARH